VKLAIINGPNLNLTGTREMEIYGRMNFDEFFAKLKITFPNLQLAYFQSNIEGELVDAVQKFGMDKEYTGMIINAGAYSHTSIAIADAIAAVANPAVAVHISNIYARESERHTDLLQSKCHGVIIGFGLKGYELAVWHFMHKG
jgi:3-dehydroquinate dehydratase-2